MADETLDAASVRQALRLVAGIDLDEAEAAALIPLIRANARALARLDGFDVREVRPAVLFDPTRL